MAGNYEGLASKRAAGRGASNLAVTAVWCFIGLSLLASVLPGSPGIDIRRQDRAKQKPLNAHESPPGSEHETGDNVFATLNHAEQRLLRAEGLSHARQVDKTMSDDVCRREFPLLYPQLEELRSWYERRGGLRRETIDALESSTDPRWGFVRVIIHDHKLYIRSFKEGGETRNSALVHILEEAMNSWPTSGEDTFRSRWLNGSNIGSHGSLPSIDLILSPGDRDCFPSEGGWMVTKNRFDHAHKGTWLIPDFGFAGWPEAGAGSYEEFRGLAAEVESRFPWSQKLNKLFWRGYANFYPVRQDLMHRTSIKDDPTRAEWADVHETTFHNDVGDFVPIVKPHDHCQHKFLIHTEGNSYSGRSKYLFSCNSVVVAHPLEWTQHFHPALNNLTSSPNQNYVQLPGPHFTGLEETAKELQRADDGSRVGYGRSRRSLLDRVLGNAKMQSPQAIADNAVRTLRDRE